VEWIYSCLKGEYVFMAHRKTALVVLLLTIAAASVGCGSNLPTPNGLLNLETVVNIFDREGLNLITDYSKSPDAYELNGVKPAIFRIGRTGDNLLIYIYKTFVEEEIYDPFSFERITFNSRNALIVYIPAKVPTNQDELKPVVETGKRISEIVFKYLNNGKEVVYKGESEHWEATIILKYYRHWWEDENNRRHYQSYHTESHGIQYKLADIKNVGPVSYEHEGQGGSGGGTGLTLNDEGYADAGTSGGNGWLSGEPEKEVYHVVIKWNGKEERFDLEAQD